MDPDPGGPSKAFNHTQGQKSQTLIEVLAKPPRHARIEPKGGKEEREKGPTYDAICSVRYVHVLSRISIYTASFLEPDINSTSIDA